MLETIRRHQRSLLIYLIFGGLIAVFAINFGPASGGGADKGGCSSRDTWVARIADHSVGEGSWRYALLGITGGSGSGARARAEGARERVMNMLLQREVLASEAEARGFRITDEEAEGLIAKGQIYLAGYPLDGKQAYYNKDGAFDYDLLEQFVKGRGLTSVPAFVSEQKRELLAQRVRELVRGSARVSPEEVWTEYEKEHLLVSATYVKFETYRYARELELQAGEIDAIVAAKDAELKKTYEAQKSAFTGLPKQLKVRQIFFKSAKPVDDESAPETLAATDEVARGKAQAALARVKGGEDFAKVARDVSIDKKPASAVWRSLTSLGGPEVKKAVEGLGTGAVSEVIETPQGFYVIKVEGTREGDQTYDQVKRDLAEELLRDEKSKALAKKDAEDALAKAKAGTALDAQFEKLSTGSDDEGNPTSKPVAVVPPPAPGMPERPKLLEANDLQRAGAKLTGIGESKELSKALFETLAPEALGDKVYEVKGPGDKVDYVVVKLVKRVQPDKVKFEEEKAQIASSLGLVKGYRLVDELADRRCREARDKGELVVNPAYVEYGDVDAKTGRPIKTQYTPCEDPLGR